MRSKYSITETIIDLHVSKTNNTNTYTKNTMINNKWLQLVPPSPPPPKKKRKETVFKLHKLPSITDCGTKNK